MKIVRHTDANFSRTTPGIDRAIPDDIHVRGDDGIFIHHR